MVWRLRQHATAVFFAIAFALATLAPQPGLTWDEPTYVAQGIQYVDWLRRAVPSGGGADDPMWTFVVADHPPLAKLAYGIAASIRPARVSAFAAARLVSALMFAALVGLTVYATGRGFGERASWLAGSSLLLMPQVLAHAQFAALDLPVTLAWLTVAVVSSVAPRGWRGAAILGALWGIALLTKVNGVFLAGPIFIWGLASRRLRWKDVPIVVILALVTFCLAWPWLWHDTLTRIQAYVVNKQNRWIVPTLYFGHIYDDRYPPWHYPLVLTVATLPLAVLVGVAIGTFVLIRERPSPTAWLALHLAFTLGLACLPGVPRYDGTRLFLPAFPFVAILAGVGLDRLLRVLASVPRAGPALVGGALLAGLGSAVVDIVRAAPCLLSSYAPQIGGLWGADRLGLEITYWGDAVTPELLTAIPAGARVAAVPMGIDYVRALQDARFLRADAVPAYENRCDLLITIGRRGMLKQEFLERFEREPGVAETRRSGVILAKLLPGNSATAAVRGTP